MRGAASAAPLYQWRNDRMFTIETPRLILTSTPLDVMKTRIERDDFVAAVPVSIDRDGQHVSHVLSVHFVPEWSGGPLASYPHRIAEREAHSERDEWRESLGTIIDRAELVAVGGMGFKDLPGEPGEAGTVEIGYDINPSYQGRGYATEMVRAAVVWALRQPTMRRVTAECLEDNAASIRVLEKAGFAQIGRRMDDEGPLLLWERRANASELA